MGQRLVGEGDAGSGVGTGGDGASSAVVDVDAFFLPDLHLKLLRQVFFLRVALVERVEVVGCADLCCPQPLCLCPFDLHLHRAELDERAVVAEGRPRDLSERAAPPEHRCVVVVEEHRVLVVD